ARGSGQLECNSRNGSTPVFRCDTPRDRHATPARRKRSNEILASRLGSRPQYDQEQRLDARIAQQHHLQARRSNALRSKIGLRTQRDSTMEFGMFHEFPSMPGRGETEMFDEAMAQVDAAERWGLAVMW